MHGNGSKSPNPIKNSVNGIGHDNVLQVDNGTVVQPSSKVHILDDLNNTANVDNSPIAIGYNNDTDQHLQTGRNTTNVTTTTIINDKFSSDYNAINANTLNTSHVDNPNMEDSVYYSCNNNHYEVLSQSLLHSSNNSNTNNSSMR